MTASPAPPGRTEQKRGAILDAATALFLRNGFRGTSMDDIARAAKVSKQTVYKQFADKERLFRDIVTGVSANSDTIVAAIDDAFGTTPARDASELEPRLVAVARGYLDGVLQSHVLSLRRLIIAEVEQFPDLAAAYFATGPTRGIDLLVARLGPYAAAGILVAPDLRIAAAHFAYLSLSVAQDRAMFLPADLPDEAERDRLSRAAARAFLAAYGGPAGGERAG